MRTYAWRIWINRLRTALRNRSFGLPDLIGIELSTACNMRCQFCIRGLAPQKQNILSEELWALYLFRLREAHWRGITNFAFYSEPSLVADLTRRIHNLRSLHTLPYVFTNGSKPEAIEDWLKAGAARVIVTEHEPFTWTQFTTLCEIKANYPFRVRILRMRDRDIIEYVDTYPRLYGGIPMRRCCLNNALCFNQKGEIQLCCFDYECVTGLGNLRDKPILDLWHEPRYTAIRKSAARGKPILPFCRKCLGIP